MNAETLATRARATAFAAGRYGRLAVRNVLHSRLLRWRYRGPRIERLVLMPPDLRTADPSFAAEIYHGHFGLAGEIAMTGTESPFLIEPPSEAWKRELHGFGWLRHFHAAGDEISREHARALVRDWIAVHGRPGGFAWRPDITGRRVISWLSHAGVFLRGADEMYYETALESLAEQLRFLRANYRDAPPGVPRLTALIALTFAGICTEEHQSSGFARPRAFAEELRNQILPDGGHISRNPRELVEIALDLLPLRQCFVARDQAPPPELLAALDRIMPMIRFFRFGDSSLARFNGSGATPIAELAAVLSHDDVQGEPVAFAHHSGYCRLKSGDTIVIADTGHAPPLAYSTAAHAGCLSFEMSSGIYPLIVNCGAPERGDASWRIVSRSTAAHSTVVVNDASSSQFVPVNLMGGGRAEAPLANPVNVQAGVKSENGALELRASHDGYDARFGISHVRRIVLSANGERLMGADQLVTAHGLKGAARANDGAFAIRFHLHPSVRAELSQDARTVLMVMPNHEGWRLTVRTGTLAVDESVFLADSKGPRRATQVVVYGAFGGASEVTVHWTLERTPVAARVKDERETAAGNELPLGEGGA